MTEITGESSTNIEAQHLLAESWIEKIYENNEGRSSVEEFHDRHGVNSMLILTVGSYYAAQAEVQKLLPEIEGKTVVEVGAGVGMLALQMARYAKYVWAIECDPAWSWVFTEFLYKVKPSNLTWIFGKAQDLIGILHADVAVVYTRSNLKGMGAIASKMAARVVRGPLVESDERYGYLTEEQRKFIQEISTEEMLKTGSMRGLSGDVLRDLEKRTKERFPELYGAP